MSSSNSQPSASNDSATQARALNGAIARVGRRLEPLLSGPRKGELRARLSALEHAQLSVCSSYTVAALFYVLLKTHGINPREHPIKQELDRVQRYVGKLREHSRAAQQAAAQQAGGDGDAGAGEKPRTACAGSTRLDRAAAGRLINGALASDATWQRARRRGGNGSADGAAASGAGTGAGKRQRAGEAGGPGEAAAKPSKRNKKAPAKRKKAPKRQG
eukprot:g3729.t1